MEKRALILGANGRFGRHAAEAFWNAGWRVTMFDRWKDDLNVAAMRQSVIVNAWNPPYQHWARELPGLTARVIAAARASGARVVIPGNLYVYGADAPPVFAPDTPHRATNLLGRLRIEMEAAYRAAGIKTLIVRAGDYLDTQASGNWFDLVMVAKLGKGRFVYPGDPDTPHAFGFLPDVARAMVMLCEADTRLDRFEDVGFPGYTLTGRELGQGVGQAARQKLRTATMGWVPLRLLAPVWPMARHLCEMRYLWSKAHRVDGARFAELLPGFADTPQDDALRLAIQHQIDPDQPVTRRAVAVAAE